MEGPGPFSVSNNQVSAAETIRQQEFAVLETAHGCVLSSQVGKHFDGIPSNDKEYQLNAYMKHRFPQK